MWQKYRKTAAQEMRPYIPGEDLAGISVSAEDAPELGGMIARNPDNPADQWYVAKEFFAKNYEVEDGVELTRALEDLLEEHGSTLSVDFVNYGLFHTGHLDKVQIKDDDGVPIRFMRISEFGLRYGRNEPSPHDPRVTLPRYYVAKFPELLEDITDYLSGCRVEDMYDDDDMYDDEDDEVLNVADLERIYEHRNPLALEFTVLMELLYCISRDLEDGVISESEARKRIAAVMTRGTPTNPAQVCAGDGGGMTSYVPPDPIQAAQDLQNRYGK